jgi:NAD(P)-dependent dehydrogenase (short-subunit alcohol dehydrogenase family)
MDLQLGGKSAYITGGAAGIGAAIADLLVAEGVRVAVSDIDAAGLQGNRERWGEEAVVIAADLSGPGATTAAEEALAHLGGPPDILINNVGATRPARFEDVTDEDWQANFDLNFMSHVRTSRAIVPRMAAGAGGAVVFVASDLAKQPEEIPIEYATAKAGLLSLANALSLRYAPGVRINAVCPGPIWTDAWTKPGGVADGLSTAYGLPREEAVERYVAERHLPLGIGTPQDVAALAVFLVSPLARYIAAAAVSVDGGSTRSLF